MRKTACLIAQFVLMIIFVFFATRLSAGSPKNYTEAKLIARQIWREHSETFYCGCRYNKQGRVDFQQCGYKPKNKFSNQIGWDHIVPVSWYGQSLECWRDPLCEGKNGKKLKGRKCCQKRDKNFRHMEADLHNLVPVIREVNTARQNYHFGEFYFEERQEKFRFHDCNMIIDEYYRVLEPRDEVKGVVARVHFYMASKYGIKLSEKQKRLMMSWNKRFPPTEWERRWHHQVAIIQEDKNTYDTIWSGQIAEKGELY